MEKLTLSFRVRRRNSFIDGIYLSNEISKKSSSWTIEDFEIGYLLGRGRFDYVYCGREKQTCFIVAYKILFKAPFKNSKMLQQVKREIEIQSSLKGMFGEFYEYSNYKLTCSRY
ncbi:unnamed protein product [Rotaria sp. Silwood1]|nr:unnamed protein product [Rotaria sp. Silwood1]